MDCRSVALCVVTESVAWRMEGPSLGMFGQIGKHTLNSSHITISYAVFCLKKQKKTNNKLMA